MRDGSGSESGWQTAGEESPAAEFATEPFELVTEETRAAILGALAAHQAENPRDRGLGFSELRDRAAVDDSGNFNYHLGKLRPAHVRQTEDGYVLTFAGMSLAGILRAGVDAEITRGPVSLDGRCGLCDTELTVEYERRVLSVTCENDHRYPRDELPPNAVTGRTLREAISIQTCRTKHLLDLVRRGVCPACFGDVEREHQVLDAPQASHVLVATCTGCGRVTRSPVGVYLLDEPAVVAFYHDHGIDVTETPLWALDLPIAEPTVRSEDPLRLSLSVERDGERLTLVVDEYTNLLDSRRTPVDAD
ncbi:MAG: hypothetical protein J07HX64_02918 [halophilic archaeon J07HX64]|jgi:hypothetical protein|nr:MAG: hypothetical protein J07HX64_02918 [halophilic archaeon J07HX64]